MKTKHQSKWLVKCWGIAASLILAALGVALTAGALAAQESASSPKTVTILVYEPGRSWAKGQPADKQNLGPHSAYVKAAFDKGEVVAYGPQVDAVRGYYILNTADAAAVHDFSSHDPAVLTGMFSVAAALPWTVSIDAFSPSQPGENFFLLRMQPGPKWETGKPITAQNIGDHFAYMAAKAKEGIIVAAGPSMRGDEGFYVVRGSAEVKDKLLAGDPAVQRSLFKPLVVGWEVLAMQHSH